MLSLLSFSWISFYILGLVLAMARSLSLEYTRLQLELALHIPIDCKISGISWDPISQNLTVRVDGVGLPMVASGEFPLCLRVHSTECTEKEMEELMGRLT
jgi:hypothetical protein